MQELHNITRMIEKIIENPKNEHGTHLYHKSTDLKIDEGDESATRIQLYRRWDTREEMDEADMQLMNELGNIGDTCFGSDTDFCLLESQQWPYIWNNKWGDSIQIHISDSTIRIITINSGQY